MLNHPTQELESTEQATPIANPEWVKEMQEAERIQKENVKIQEEMAIKQFKQQARYNAIAVVSESLKIVGLPIDGNKTIAQRITDQAETIYQWMIKDL